MASVPITLDAIILPEDLNWSDEFQWSPVARSTDYSLTGALIVEESLKQAGRPITLEAKSEFRGPVWIDRDTVDALYAKAAVPGTQMTLTLSDSRTFTVMFKDDGVKATPVYHVMPHDDADPYYLTLSLQTI